MDRINELLAKGIGNLTDEELAELRQLAKDEAERIIDECGSSPSDEQAAALEALADTLDAAKAEGKERTAKAQATAEKVQSIAERIAAMDDEDTDEDPDGEPAVIADADAETEDGEEAVEDEPVAVAAAGETVEEPALEPVAAGAKPVVTRVEARRPDRRAGRPAAQPMALVASAAVPGIVAGAKMDDPERIARAFQSVADVHRGVDGRFKVPVLTAALDYPESRQLDRDEIRNASKLKAVTSPEAITASGGVCSPVPYRYDLPYVGVSTRPVRDALPRFGAQRGGVRTLVPPTIADVGGHASQWTMANDENPSSPTTKPYLTIGCDASEVTTDVYAITESFKVGNFRQRWDPERVKAILDLAGTYTARFAEAKMLKAIKDGSKLINHGQVLGTAHDVFTALRQLTVGMRYRHRMGRNVALRVILPEWVLDNLLTDLIRVSGDGGTLEERLAMAESEVARFFKAMNVNVTWHMDYEFGVGIGATGGPFGGTQGVGNMIGYPTKCRAYVFLEGSWLFLDGGTFDFGVIRDQTLIGTNDSLLFSEFMENVHYHGVPGETYAVDLDICANGGYASPLDINPCVSGS